MDWLFHNFFNLHSFDYFNRFFNNLVNVDYFFLRNMDNFLYLFDNFDHSVHKDLLDNFFDYWFLDYFFNFSKNNFFYWDFHSFDDLYWLLDNPFDLLNLIDVYNFFEGDLDDLLNLDDLCGDDRFLDHLLNNPDDLHLNSDWLFNNFFYDLHPFLDHWLLYNLLDLDHFLDGVDHNLFHDLLHDLGSGVNLGAHASGGRDYLGFLV